MGGVRLLQLRSGRSEALDRYQEHGRIRPGTIDVHLNRIAADWLRLTGADDRGADSQQQPARRHSDNTVQQSRLDAGQLDPSTATPSPAASAPTSVRPW